LGVALATSAWAPETSAWQTDWPSVEIKKQDFVCRHYYEIDPTKDRDLGVMRLNRYCDCTLPQLVEIPFVHFVVVKLVIYNRLPHELVPPEVQQAFHTLITADQTCREKARSD
jgi:hypothetical protein